MTAAEVHVRSSADALAKGMSWPARTTAIQSAIAACEEAELWLLLSKKDKVKEWARDGRAGVLMQESTLMLCHFERRGSWRIFDLFEKEGPDEDARNKSQLLISCYLYSIPASVMGETSLTKDKVADAFTSILRRIARPITQADWRITLALRGSERSLEASLFRRPVRNWELVETQLTRLRHTP
jgi:hypothetical protein